MVFIQPERLVCCSDLMGIAELKVGVGGELKKYDWRDR